MIFSFKLFVICMVPASNYVFYEVKWTREDNINMSNPWIAIVCFFLYFYYILFFFLLWLENMEDTAWPTMVHSRIQQYTITRTWTGVARGAARNLGVSSSKISVKKYFKIKNLFSQKNKRLLLSTCHSPKQCPFQIKICTIQTQFNY